MTDRFIELYDFVQRLFGSVIDMSVSFLNFLNTDVTAIIESWESVGLVDQLFLNLIGIGDLEHIKLYMLMVGAGLVTYATVTLIGWFWRFLPFKFTF